MSRLYFRSILGAHCITEFKAKNRPPAVSTATSAPHEPNLHVVPVGFVEIGYKLTPCPLIPNLGTQWIRYRYPLIRSSQTGERKLVGTDPWRLSTGGRCYLAHPGTLLGGYNRLSGRSLHVTVPVSGRFWSFQTRSKKEARTNS